jgi:glycosyltransferase involved in cell wall biosynthesis
MSEAIPAVVVIPAHRETASLTALLCSIPDDVPVIVAVDGGHPPTVATARRHGATVVALEVNGGSYAARNAALQHLPDDSGIVLFTDADCVVTAGWIEEHRRALIGAELSGGGVRFTFRRERPTPAEWVDAIRHLKQDVYIDRDGFAATCNLAVRRSVVADHQFDARLRTGGDAEFCRRVVAAGARLVYTPDAAVEHPARDLRELVTKVRRLASGIPGQAARWQGRPLPSRRLTRGVWRRAQAQGYDVGPLWGVSACLLDWSLNLYVRRAVIRLPRERPA